MGHIKVTVSCILQQGKTMFIVSVIAAIVLHHNLGINSL